MIADDVHCNLQSVLFEVAKQELEESASIAQLVASSLVHDVTTAGLIIVKAIQRGNKVLICGNGGSAADAQHLAAEIVNRFELERTPLPAIALTSDGSILTAAANDFGFRQVFARQVQALARSGDVLIALSTSGNSANIVEAVAAGRAKKCTTIALTGCDGGRLRDLVDLWLAVPTRRVSRAQESHMTICHAICRIIDVQSETQRDFEQ